MSEIIVSAKSGTSYPPTPAGTHAAICYAIISTGTHLNTFYGNYAKKLIVMWEIPGETIEIEGEVKPRAISETYTESLSEKANFRKMLESWRGKKFTEDELSGFKLSNLLGAPCLINVIHNEGKNNKVYATVASVSPLPKGMSVSKDTYNDKIIFNISDPEEDLDVMKSLPNWVQDRIRESKEYKDYANNVRGPSEEGFTPIESDEDLPF